MDFLEKHSSCEIKKIGYVDSIKLCYCVYREY